MTINLVMYKLRIDRLNSIFGLFQQEGVCFVAFCWYLVNWSSFFYVTHLTCNIWIKRLNKPCRNKKPYLDTLWYETRWEIFCREIYTNAVEDAETKFTHKLDEIGFAVATITCKMLIKTFPIILSATQVTLEG